MTHAKEIIEGVRFIDAEGDIRPEADMIDDSSADAGDVDVERPESSSVEPRIIRKLAKAAEILGENIDNVPMFLESLTEAELNKVFSIASQSLDIGIAIRSVNQPRIRQTTRADRRLHANQLAAKRDAQIVELLDLDLDNEEMKERLIAWRYFFRRNAQAIFDQAEARLHPPEERPRDWRERQFKDN